MPYNKQYEFKGIAVQVKNGKEIPLSSKLTLRTWANSEIKARAQLTFQVKLSCNLDKIERVKIYGELHEV